MTDTNLDYIVKNYLLKKGYPLHWYMQCLVYSTDALRELTFDDLRVINTKILPVNQVTNTAPLPSDYQDYVTLGAMVGQRLKPLVPTTTLNPLTSLNTGSNFEQQQWTDTIDTGTSGQAQL